MLKGWNPFRKKCITRMPYKIESPISDILQKGDVILYRAGGNQILGGLIAELTESPYSHVEVYVGDGWSIEAGAYGVSFSNGFHDYAAGIDILRWKSGLTDDQKRIILGKAYQSLAKPYEYSLLLGFPYFSRKAAVKRAANQAYICSEIVAWCYSEAGLNACGNNNPTSVQAPADFGYSKNFEWLGCFSSGIKIEDAKKNEWNLAIQGKRNWFSKLVIDLLADPFSKKDEYYKKLHDSQSIMATSWKTSSKKKTSFKK